MLPATRSPCVCAVRGGGLRHINRYSQAYTLLNLITALPRLCFPGRRPAAQHRGWARLLVQARQEGVLRPAAQLFW